MPKVYQHIVKVTSEDLDWLNHVNNIVYLRFIQDIAGKHWLSTVTPEEASQLIWVVRRHEIDYLKSAFLDDELTVKTWVESFSGVTSNRHCEISRGNEVLVRSCTIWVALDSQTHKPKRVSSTIAEKF